MLQSKRSNRVVAALAGVLLLSACSSVDADKIGVVYSAGSMDGQHYLEVTEQGESLYVGNDDLYQIPLSTRSYVLDADDSSADVQSDISVPSADQTVVDFKVAVAFSVNTFTEDIEGYEGGSLRAFVEKVCLRYNCTEESGWRTMLAKTMKPSLDATFKDIAQDFTGPELIYNLRPAGADKAALDSVKAQIGKAFQRELVRLLGAEYFCGPTFDRALPARGCPPIELTITKVEYHNEDLQASREAKRIAEEKAAATKVESDALAAQQRALQKALSNPAYVRYLESKNRLDAAKACAQSEKNCVLVIGTDANVNVPAGG